MPRMCEVPGCGELACYAVAIEEFKLHVCLAHQKNVMANLTRMRAQLADHAHGAPCILPGCGEAAVAQIELRGTWHNHCAAHAKKITENLTILRGGQAPGIRPLKTFYDVPPTVIVEELPVGG
jgi:hypothetical protein